MIGAALASLGPWNSNIHNVNMAANPPILIQLNQLESYISDGHLCLVEGIHFTIADVPALYLLASGAYLLDNDAGNGIFGFPFQTFDWPAFHVVLIWTMTAPVQPPANVRPNPGSVLAWMRNTAVERGDGGFGSRVLLC